jgi:NAD(P)-dependent dehydrogenase (short-subunit alcohol dehydrogenase family)
VEKTVGAFGGFDYLVDSAGIQTYGTVVDAPEETCDRTLAVNLKGACLAPGTRARRRCCRQHLLGAAPGRSGIALDRRMNCCPVGSGGQ